MLRKVHAFFHPENFRGWGKKKNYFEGWYFKLLTADEQTALAVIPGVAMGRDGARHAFIQVLDGKKKTSRYHTFNIEAFRPTPYRFDFGIGNNHFSEKGMELDLPGLKGSIRFGPLVHWPKPFYSPGIMGPYSFAPFMECYHGIVSLDHSLEGRLLIEGEDRSFDGGRGYAEKDWGRSFPSAYFWMQSNHFSRPGISLKCSVAKIPWLRSAFTGFIAGLWLDKKLYRFTTYNGTRLLRSYADEQQVEIILENRRHRLEITAHRDGATALASPIHGFMEGRIEESMTAVIEVKLLDPKTKTPVFSDRGRNAGLEVAGNIAQIMC